MPCVTLVHHVHVTLVGSRKALPIREDTCLCVGVVITACRQRDTSTAHAGQLACAGGESVKRSPAPRNYQAPASAAEYSKPRNDGHSAAVYILLHKDWTVLPKRSSKVENPPKGPYAAVKRSSRIGRPLRTVIIVPAVPWFHDALSPVFGLPLLHSLSRPLGSLQSGCESRKATRVVCV